MYLTWTTLPLANDPRIIGHCIHTRIQPTTLIISLNDVKRIRRSASDRTSKHCHQGLLIMSGCLVEPIGFEPMTSCLQSRRSTN